MKILIPMAGAGSRFSKVGYQKPKPLIDVAGEPMIRRVLESLDLPGQYIFVVREYDENVFNEELAEVLRATVEDPIIVTIDRLTNGAAETCLLAEEHLDDEELVITNCDQVFNWSSRKFLEQVAKWDVDGVIHTYENGQPNNSFVALDEEGFATRFAEKQVISNHALTGFHYWKRGSDFVQSARAMIAADDRTKNEYYIAPSYNYLLKMGRKVRPYCLEADQTILIGTPEDLDAYLHSL